MPYKDELSRGTTLFPLSGLFTCSNGQFRRVLGRISGDFFPKLRGDSLINACMHILLSFERLRKLVCTITSSLEFQFQEDRVRFS